MSFCPPTTAYDDGVVILQPYPYYLNGKPHSGIDIYSQAYRGHKPRATEDGKVIEIINGNDNKVGGVVIEVESTGDWLNYFHVSAKTLKVKDKVKCGDILGEFDDSGKGIGKWQGYHLHFGVRECLNRELTDPVLYFLHANPDMIFYMRDEVKKYYCQKQYFEIMNIRPIPWEK